MSFVDLPHQCRWCSHMFCGDANWCEKLEVCKSDSTIKRTNKCKSFAGEDICAITGETWEPKQKQTRERKELIIRNQLWLEV